MAKYFLDTNIFIRLLLKEDDEQHQLAKKLFKKAEENKIDIWTNEIVILEIEWVLRSYYKHSKNGVYQSLTKVLAIKNLKVNNKKLVIEAVKHYYEKNVDLTDAVNYLLAVEENKEVISFDEDFDKLGKRVDLKKLVK